MTNTENNVAAQAGYEPMDYTEQLRAAVETVCEGWTLPPGARKTLEIALWAPRVSPRATADVERVRPTKELLLEAIDDKVSRAEDLMSDFPPHRAMERWNEANHTLREIVDELFATTKPGA